MSFRVQLLANFNDELGHLNGLQQSTLNMLVFIHLQIEKYSF
jgi:hypothetical protein